MAAATLPILIVDDEEALLRLMSLYLTRLGYEPATFARAGAALDAFRSDPHRFPLVIADLSLPDMEGHQMALRMMECNPNLKVLLCTGHPFDTETLPDAVRSRFSVLQKPFLPQVLAEAVKELLPPVQS